MRNPGAESLAADHEALEDIALYDKYNRDYFENGISLGTSLYENYRWLPELTMRMAHFLILRLGIGENQRVLDFGCAKGYLVKAFRLLGIEAYGCDISRYAIAMADPEIKAYCRRSSAADTIPFANEGSFDWVIAKDVLEHLNESELGSLLDNLHHCARRIFAVIPLGERERFMVPEYNRDPTHLLAKPPKWWKHCFYVHGWFTNDFQYSMTALKENWARRYPRGNGLFTLTRIQREG